MAFTEAQKAAIREYLGYSDRYHQMDTALEQAMTVIEQRPDTQTRIEALLAALADIDERITGAYGRLKAAAVGDIRLMEHREIFALRSEGRRVAGRMAATFGVNVRHDAYSGAGPRGDNYYPHG